MDNSQMSEIVENDERHIKFFFDVNLLMLKLVYEFTKKIK